MDLLHTKKSTVITVIGMILAGIAVNFALSVLVYKLSMPLYLNTIGTVLVAMLGGAFPGIMVGFFSTIFFSFFEPLAVYYGIIYILIAVCTVYFYKKHYFKSVRKTILAIVALALLNGVLGSVFSWFLFGFDFTTNASAPFVQRLLDSGISNRFSAQLGGGFIADILDKTCVVVLSLWIFRFIPLRIKNLCAAPFSLHEIKTPMQLETRLSLLRKVIIIVVISELLLGALACTIGYYLNKNVATRNYENIGKSATDAAASLIDPDMVATYLAQGRSAEGYNELEKQLFGIKNSFPQVKFYYAYAFDQAGCHVLFDFDAEGVEADEVGEIIPVEESFAALVPDFIAGKDVAPVVTNDEYGWLMTVYRALRNKDGKAVAYIAADVSMMDIKIDNIVFFIKTLSLFFGLSIIIMAFVLEAVKRGIVYPVNAMARGTLRFTNKSTADRRNGLNYLNSLNIHTFDEIENLYKALVQMASESTTYIDQLTEMQEKLIYKVAELVEARDKCTGDHLKNTSYYVLRIVDQMQQEGKYPDQINDEFFEKVCHAAPLHDLGKIQISDAVLNKPGKLTDEEFAIMKSHSEEGAKILRNITKTMSTSIKIDYLEEAIDMAHYHHEKWDGTGYPEHLAGTDIPLSARIMAVADVFDALIMRRSYKEPFSYEKTLQIMTEGIGKHFDPVIMESFLHIIKDLYEERQLKESRRAEREAKQKAGQET